jgi:hypothetical protein
VILEQLQLDRAEALQGEPRALLGRAIAQPGDRAAAARAARAQHAIARVAGAHHESFVLELEREHRRGDFLQVSA